MSAQAKNGCCDSEVEDEASGVAEGGDKRVGEDGRIGSDFLCDDRHEPTYGCGHHAYRQQRKANNGADCPPVDKPCDDEAEAAEQGPEQTADTQLSPNDAPEISDPDFADSKCSGDSGCGLVAGVSASAGQKRNKQCEYDHLVQSILVDLQDLNGQHRRDSEHE